MKISFNKILICSLLPGLFLLAGTATARSLVLLQNLQDLSPFYIRLSIGNHQGCPDTDDCVSRDYQVLLTADKAKLTLAKEILIGSDETLDNSLHDTGAPAADLDFSFSTPFYKGVIFKLFPDSDATLEDTVRLMIKIDEEPEQLFSIPYKLLSSDSLSVLSTAAQVDPQYSDWGKWAGRIQLQVLGLGRDQQKVAVLFRHKLEFIKKMLGLERYMRDQLLSDRISNLTYTELQKALEVVWNGVPFNSEDLRLFNYRFARLRHQINNDKISPALLVGNLKRMLLTIEANWVSLQ